MSAVIKLSAPATHEFWEIPVLFEDDHLLALDKPAGLLTSPDSADPQRPSLMELLHKGIAEGKPWARDHGLSHLANVHRLDPEISGVLLLAKSKAILVKLADLFGNEKPERIYVVLAQGNAPQDRFEVEAKLAPHPTNPELMRVEPRHGKRARTLFAVRERFDGYTLLQCQPLTDRRHQIRVHLRHARLPIVGDHLYRGGTLWLSSIKPGYRLKPGHTERPLLATVALHAESLSLPHPVTGAPLRFQAASPKTLNVALKYLRRCAPAWNGLAR